jgi:anti-sigma regulatory factor (Ser/Thr protein kinase)
LVEKRLKLLLPSKPENLEAIRYEIGGFVSGTDFEGRIKDILLVTSEACTNVVRHAYDGKCERQNITIECILRAGKLTVLVCDRGKGLGNVRNRTLFTEEGGFGLYLMKELTDRFKSHSSRFGTVVELGFDCEAVNSKVRSRPVILISPHSIKAYTKIKAFTLFVSTQTEKLNNALDVNDYDLANTILNEVLGQVDAINRSYCRLTPRTRSVIKEWLASNAATLKQVERILIQNEISMISSGSGIYGMIRQRETINLLSDIITGLETALGDKDSCWIALDDGPLQLT